MAGITESALGDMGNTRGQETIVSGHRSWICRLQRRNNPAQNAADQPRNSAYAGRYIFTGFKTDQKLLDEAGNFLVDVSNSEQIFYQIGLADSVNINVLGGDLFNSGTDITAGSTGKFIQDMNELIQAFDDADYEAIRSMTQNFSDNLDNVLRLRADVGARINRLELTANRMMNDNTNFTRLMSENENVDMTDTIMNLKNEENVYRASLAGGARIIMPSLIDFLR